MSRSSKLALAVAAALASSAASAYDFVVGDPIFIDTTSFGAGQTEIFTDMSAPNLPVTSVYDSSGVAGIAPGNEATTLVGKTLPFTDTGEGTLESLVGLNNTQNAGFRTTWDLTFTYSVGGVATFVDDIFNTNVVAPGFKDGSLDAVNNTTLAVGPDGQIDPFDGIAPIYDTSGTGLIEVFFNNYSIAGTKDVKLLEFNLVQASVTGPNVVFYAEGDYGWYTAGSDSFVEDFFNHVPSGKSFFELWQSNALDPVEVILRADFNVDPPFLPTCADAACNTVVRSTDLNLTTKFDVPVPAPLALFGIGLMGLGLLRRRAA